MNSYLPPSTVTTPLPTTAPNSHQANSGGGTPTAVREVRRSRSAPRETGSVASLYSRASSVGRSMVRTATMLYRFQGVTAREMASVGKGDVVRVHRQVDDNWLEVERNGQVGLVPLNYVQIEGEEGEMEAGGGETRGVRRELMALFDFQARNGNELSLKRVSWWG